MQLTTAFALAALVSSALLLQGPGRPWAIAPLVASVIRVAMAIGLLSLSLKGVSLALLLGCAIGIGGLVLFTKSTTKAAISASTILCIVGIAEILRALQLIQFR